MMLQAAELGIGSCWVGYFNAQEIAEVLGLPAHVTVSALLPIGYTFLRDVNVDNLLETYNLLKGLVK